MLVSLKTPNFFLLGAGKSGTTSLYAHLREHPEIFMPEVKEPSFFCESFQVVGNPIKYFELYDAATTELRIGEASHVYLSNPATARVLRALFPAAKFLVILRNPADRAFSLYHHMRRAGLETIDTFEAALQEEEHRFKSDEFMADSPQYPYNFLYFRSGLYGAQLRNYFGLFPKDQFHVIKFENFASQPARHFESIFKFLGVDPNFHSELRVRNAAVENAPILQATREQLLRRYAPDLELLRGDTGIHFEEQPE